MIDRRRFLKFAGVGCSLTAFDSAKPARASIVNDMKPGDKSGPRLEISSEALDWNLKELRRRIGNLPVMGVIKANAYGLGLIETAKHFQNLGIEYLAVASATSALSLRDAGITCPVLNLGPFTPSEANELVERGITQSIYADDFAMLNEVAKRNGRKPKVHLNIDTGMGRLGVPYYRAMPLIKKVAAATNLEIEGVFTSLTEEKQFDKEQIKRLTSIWDSANKKGIDLGLRHAASSAAIIDYPGAYLDMVRPGITLYGYYPSARAFNEKRIDLKPSLKLKTCVLYVKTLRPGDGVSYHRPFKAQRETKVATLGIGYSDGYSHHLVEKTDVLIGGKRCPLIAAITANHMTAMLPDDSEVKIGDEVVVIGKQGNEEIALEEVANRLGESEYKLLIGMNPLMNRTFL